MDALCLYNLMQTLEEEVGRIWNYLWKPSPITTWVHINFQLSLSRVCIRLYKHKASIFYYLNIIVVKTFWAHI